MKVLMIGLGSIGQRHLRYLKRKFGDELEILAYRKLRRQEVFTDKLEVEKNANLEERYNIKVFDNMNDALKENPEVAFICNPTSLHITYAIECAKAGCHLFIEKPLSNSMEGIEKLKKICEKNGLIVQVGFQFRFNPLLKMLKEKIEKNAVGDVLSVHVDIGEHLPDWHKYEDYRQTYAAKNELGGGVVLTQIHDIDYIYWLFGMPEKVYAAGGKLSDLEIDVEDTVDILLQMRFKDKKLPVSIHMDYVQRPSIRTCKVIGINGNIIMDLVKTSIVVCKTDGSEERHSLDFERNQMFIDEIDHFFDCINKKSKPLVNLDEGMKSLKIALAVKKYLD